MPPIPTPGIRAKMTVRLDATDRRRLARIRKIIDARSDAEALRRAIAIAEAHLDTR